MKLMRLAVCAAAFAVVGGIAVAEDMDIKALQAKLAAQEARLNDLQAKMGSGSADTPANIISMRKNAKVTIGGEVATRYYYRDAEIETEAIPGAAAGGMANGTKSYGNVDRADLEIGSAKLNVQVDVNEHMDAYLQMDLHDAVARDGVSGVAQTYWVRWKNIANSGWGVLVGRDGLKFGMAHPIGIRDQYNHEQGADADYFGLQNLTLPGFAVNGANVNQYTGQGMFLVNGMLPNHIGLGQTRTTQISPYWENACKTFKAEFSVFQRVEGKSGKPVNESLREDNLGNDYYDRRSVNYGVGSGSLRLTWTPNEEWVFTAGAINMHTNGKSWFSEREQGDAVAGSFFRTNPNALNKNNYAFHLAAKYTPAAFCERLTLWANMTSEYNAGYVDNLDTLVVTAGAMYALTDKLTVFGMGDYMSVSNDNAKGNLEFNEGSGWRSYVGAKYNLGGGAVLEAGWMHDSIDYEDARGYEHTKYTGDTIYGHLGFQF